MKKLTLEKSFCLMLVLVIAMVFQCSLFAEDAAERKPAVLIINEAGPRSLDFPLVRSMHLREGYQIDYMASRDVLTWERLQKYNTVVVLFPFVAAKPGGEPSAEALFTLLDKFLDEGGGVFFAYEAEMIDSLPMISDFTKLLMEKYGASYRRQQSLREKNDDLSARFGYFDDQVYYTDNIQPHPVTEEVKGIWYPAIKKEAKHSEGERGMPSYALFAPAPWKVIVSGSKSTFTTMEKVRFQEVPCKEAMSSETYKSEPPLFAVRDCKNGRMALYVMVERFTWVAGTHRNVDGDEESMQGGVILEKGANGKPSHFRRLLANTLKWLSEPSLKSGKLGGYVQEQAKINEPVAGPSPTMDWNHPYYQMLLDEWSKPLIGKDLGYYSPLPAWRGIIGARTVLSGAKGTVAEYAAAARKAGIQFIVFLETFENMSPEKLAQLKTECTKSSDEKLLCIPGLYIKDNRGNHQHYFGSTIGWPGKEFLTADGKMFDVQARENTSGLPHISFVLSNIHSKDSIGYFGFMKSKISAMWNMKLYSSAGLVLYENGKETEGLKENFEPYLEVQNAAANIQPLAIDLLDSPAMLDKAVEQKHFLTYVTAKTLAEVPAAIRYEYLWNPRSFISNGPLILDWNCVNRDCMGHNENFITPNYLFPVRLHVKSEVGLKEIRIWDGLKPYMKIGFNGEKEFVHVFMFSHDKQKNLVLEVRDVNGGVAVSGEQFDRNHINMHYSCSDRINGLFGRGPLFFPTVSGEKGFNFVGKGIDSFNLYATPTALNYREFESSAGKFSMPRLATRPLQEIVSEDVMWLSTRCSKYFPESEKLWGPWGTYGPLIETSLFDLRIDYVAFRNRYEKADPYNPTVAGIVAQGDISPATSIYTYRFKQDQTLKSVPIVGYRFGSYGAIRGNEMVLSICQNDKSDPISDVFNTGEKYDSLNLKRWQALTKEKKTRIETRGFFAIHGTKPGAATVILYNMGDIPWIVDASTNDIWLMADVEGRAVKAGEELKISLLSVNGEVPSQTGGWRYKKLADYQGLDGATGYQMNIARGKALPVTAGFCDLQQQDGAVEFSMEKPKSGLQIVLPVRVFGMNDRWSAFCYDKIRKMARPVGVFQGIAYARFDPEYSSKIDVAVGHPVIADNQDVVILFSVLGDGKFPAMKDGKLCYDGVYKITVNNPTDKDLLVTLKKGMDLPGFTFETKTLNLKAGELVEVTSIP